MITHLSNDKHLVLKGEPVWLQVTRTEWPCCRSFGQISYRFEDYINENNTWHIFHMESIRGTMHTFHNFWMIHGSRLGGVEMPNISFSDGFSSLHAIREPDIQYPDPCACLFFGLSVHDPMSFMMDPVGFLESLCDDWGGHIHVQLFYRTTTRDSGLLDHHVENRCALRLPQLVGIQKNKLHEIKTLIQRP